MWTCGTGGTTYDNCFIRLNTQTGAATQGPFDVTPILAISDGSGGTIPYAPGGAVTITTDSSSHVYLTTGVYTFEDLQFSPPANATPRVAAFDVTTSGSESLTWVTPSGAMAKRAAGQFPVAIDPENHSWNV